MLEIKVETLDQLSYEQNFSVGDQSDRVDQKSFDQNEELEDEVPIDKKLKTKSINVTRPKPKPVKKVVYQKIVLQDFDEIEDDVTEGIRDVTEESPNKRRKLDPLNSRPLFDCEGCHSTFDAYTTYR